MKRNDVLALAARVEAATGADRELDAHVHCVREGLTFVLIGTGNEAYGDICDPSDSGYGSNNTTVRGTLYARYPDNKNPPTLGGGRRGNIVQGCEPALYTASLDAALTLVPSGWVCTHAYFNDQRAVFNFTKWRDGNPMYASGVALTPALALTAAALRAIEAIAAWNRRTPPAIDAGEREAVARAIAPLVYATVTGNDVGREWEEMPEYVQDIYFDAADAALSALAPYRTTERATEYARGLADGVKQSEAAIVAWLRSLKTAVDVAMSDVLAGPRPDDGKSLTDRAREVIGCVSLALPIAAFAIERREHAQEAGE